MCKTLNLFLFYLFIPANNRIIFLIFFNFWIII
jgi:hypothetical protein